MNRPSLQDKRRLLSLALGVVFLFSVLIAQYYGLQIIEYAKWSKEASKQHFFVVKEPCSRGSFYANCSVKKGHPDQLKKLVGEIEKFHLFADPGSIPEQRKKSVALVLEKLLSGSNHDTLAISSQLAKKSRSRKLASWIDVETKESILKWWRPYAKKFKIPSNALYFEGDYQRSYPYGSLLGQVLHTVQGMRDEKTGDPFPTGGLELALDSYLKGKRGKKRLMRSPRNAIETGEVLNQPQNGADVYLTVNHVLQAIAEEELERGVKKAKAKAGWAVMLNPITGEVLALAQYPFFYPPDYQSYFNDPSLTEWTKVKAITDAYEMGSTMKPITLAIALQANVELAKRGEKPLFDPQEKMNTSNGRFPGRSKPISDTHLHHFLNMEMAIQKSSNIYMARLVERIIERLGVDWYREMLQDVFGFGVKTGIELPSESTGVLPRPGKRHKNGALEWSTPTPFSIAFGHNIQATSLQVVRAYALLANGGKRVKPFIVKKIARKNSDGTEDILLERSVKEEQVFDHAISEQIAKAMKYTTKPGGTARRADVYGYTEAGKTATAEKIVNGTYSKSHYVSSFVGFSPAKDPAFVLLVTIDEPECAFVPGVGKIHHGGTTCAPIFREIARRSLEYMGIAPDDPHGYPPGDPRYDAEKADWVKETKQLDALYQKWNAH